MTKVTRVVTSHPIVATVVAALVLATGAAGFAYWSMNQTSSSVVYFSVPEAPRLTGSGPDQTVYRIDASRSSVTYEVDEKLAGTTHSATGTTKGIAGDILIDSANPSASQIGQMVVNVQQLSSDQSVRDSRLRHDFLESDNYPLANYVTTSISGMPDAIVDGTDYPVVLDGQLTVKRATAPATLTATATRTNGELHIKATSALKLSAFDIGPINLIGLVSSGDDATLRFDLVAPEASKIGDVSQLATQTDTTQVAITGDGPSFVNAVQPILENSCAGCHQPGGPGAAIWQLETAADASKAASGLSLAVSSQYMPPWLATDAGIPLQHDRRLSTDEINTITSWAAAGGPLDVDQTAPVKPTPESYPRPDRDQVLTADAPYQGSLDLTNDYRCLVLDPKLTDKAVITGYEFEPDKAEVVHHALVYRMKGDARTAIDERDGADAGTGYRCFGGVGSSKDSLDPSGRGGGAELVMGWAPGNQPAIYPAGSGLLMDPGDFFVVQVHYHYAHSTPPDLSRMVLQYADGDLDAYNPVRVTTYLAPAEVPCGPTESGPLCDRTTVIDQLAKSFGPTAPIIADGLNLICGTSPAEIGVLDGTVARTSCDHRVRTEGQILSVLGHMHQIGKTFRMTLNPGTPDEKVLLDIDRWDFNWQLNYAPVETVNLKRGDNIRVECSWDRSLLNPAAPPRYVTWNEGTEDEMCYSTIATIEPRDR